MPIWQTKQVTAQRLRGRIENILDAAGADEDPAQWRGHLSSILRRRQNLVKHQPPYLSKTSRPSS
jgi:hypothetical protein